MLRWPSGSTRLTTVPVAAPGTTRRARSTPAACNSAIRPVPAASSPTQPASRTGVPSCARWTATFAPAPPPRVRIEAGRSEPGAGSPASTTTTSVATSPTTTTAATSGSAGQRRKRGGDPAGQLRIAQHEPDVDREGGPVAGAVQVVQDERRDRLSAHPGRVGGGQSVGDHAVMQDRVELLLDRQRVGDDDGARRQLAAGGEDGCGLLGVLHRPVHGRPGVGHVEAGEGRRPVPDGPDRQGLQALQGGRDVEDRLHARTDDGQRGARQRGEVGRLVERLRRLPVHAAEPAGGEHADAGGGRRPPAPRVANAPRRAAAASSAVLETVVAPLRRRAAATGRSRTPSLARPGSPAPRSTSSAVSPTCGTPSRMAMVAGTAPPARTAASTSSAAARLSGRGRPCASRVLSSATTGRPERSASLTSGESTARAEGPGTGEVAGCTLSSWRAR